MAMSKFHIINGQANIIKIGKIFSLIEQKVYGDLCTVTKRLEQILL